MTTVQGTERVFSEDFFREVFMALVETQDNDVNVSESRNIVASRFGISVQQVKNIEREGINQKWPPLT